MANTAPLPIIAAPPLRRATPVRHRRTVIGWQLERAVRAGKAWLAHEVSTTRGGHALVAGGYGVVAVLLGVCAAVMTR